MHLDNILTYLIRVFEVSFATNDITLSVDRDRLTITITTASVNMTLYEPALIQYSHKFLSGITVRDLNSFTCSKNDILLLQYKDAGDDLQKDKITYYNYLFSLLIILTRATEYHAIAKDSHNRPLIVDNVPYAFGQSQIPWVEVLLKEIGKGIKLEPVNMHYCELSCDLDRPIKYKSIVQVSKLIGKSILRLDLTSAIVEAHQALLSLFHKRFDPFQKGLMLLNEYGVNFQKKRLFLMTAKHGKHDDGYDLRKDIFLRSKVEQLIAAGWNLGHHPSYDTCENNSLHEIELSSFREIFNQNLVCSRQHYLRYDLKNFHRQLSALRIERDYSYGYYDDFGFLIGTTRPLPMFSFNYDKTGISTDVMEHPLLVMDSGLLKASVVRSEADVSEQLRRLHKTCEAYKIPFTVLWHNSSFDGKWQKLSLSLKDVCNDK